MIAMDQINAFAFSAPIICAMACMTMMLMDAFARRHNAQEKRLRLFLALTYLVTSLGWLGMVFYAASPRIFASYDSVFLLTLMLDQVMIYRFVSIITGTGERRRFNRLHLIIPFLFTAISVISDMSAPVGQQSAIIFLGENGSNSKIWFWIMYVLTTTIFIVYNTLYPFLNLRNIHRYRQFIVNYSSDAYHASLGWLAVIQILILITVPVPLAGLLFGAPTVAFSYFAWVGALPYFLNYLILCYNLLNDNYLIIRPEDIKENVPVKTITIDRKQFEHYLREKKPYLNPNLRMTDLAAGLNTNRSYISGFINREYNMNFCRLINRCRLHHLDRLRHLSSNAMKDNMDLVLMAGFSNYRSYLRVKKEEDRLALLKVFER